MNRKQVTQEDLAEIAHQRCREMSQDIVAAGFDQHNLLPLTDEQETIIGTAMVHACATVAKDIALLVLRGRDVSPLVGMDIRSFSDVLQKLFGKAEGTVHIKGEPK